MAQEPDDGLSLKNVALLVSGLIFVPNPPGSYVIEADRQLFLDEVLQHALRACGLEQQLKAVYDAAWAYAAPAFQKAVGRLEALRLEVMEE
jgi:hypothetical protein